MRPWIVLAVSLAGCAAPVRFADRPVLWRDPDDRPAPRPRPQAAGIQWTGLRDALLLPADRGLALDFGAEAENVNALDEVPDSSWYVDRRRSDPRPRHFTAAELARGPFGDDPGPQPPYTVVKGKTIGSTPGLVIVDARGQRYMFKLDPPGWLGMNSSTEVVATRLAWAAGWLVPAETLVSVAEAELRLDPKARTRNEHDEEVALTPERLRALLARTPRQADGTLRVCAGRWLPGKPLGSWAYFGRRADDPNDRIDHENRRDVRGFGVFAAWVNDIDTFENNTLDTYVGADGRGHVVHFQQDVGGSFGQFAAVPAEVWMGQETYFMPARIVTALVSLGALSRRWEGDERVERRTELMSKYPELGYFDDATFDPRDWHPVLDNPAFVRQTARDRYWGAKRVVAFSADEVRAAVALGHYAPATADRLFDVLWRRRERIARAFFSDVAPLDYFHFDGGRLCFDDLWQAAGLGGEARYFVDGAVRPTVEAAARPVSGDEMPPDDARTPRPATEGGRCVAVEVARGYHVVALGATRATARPAHDVRVHYVADGARAHVVGLER